MKQRTTLFPDPAAFLRAETSGDPVYFFSPAALQARARAFTAGFPGLVTYAVKANARPEVLENLAAAGVRAFDVASPAEMELIARIVPGAAMHYNNPVRSRAEIQVAIAHGVASYSVDDAGELAKLADALKGREAATEVAVRLRLPVKGAAYHFGAKFGADPEAAEALLAEVARLGFRPAMTFHPGTQCLDPSAWVSYIEVCADISRRTGVRIQCLNVGGGFAIDRGVEAVPALEAVFAAIDAGVNKHFGADRPALVCEPGRAMVADAFSFGVQVKSRRPGAVYLADGIYGGLSEAPIMGSPGGIRVFDEDGRARTGTPTPMTVFGPTCDSLDRLPGQPALPGDVAEGDWLLVPALGAYSNATTTDFNGYGHARTVTVVRTMP